MDNKLKDRSAWAGGVLVLAVCSFAEPVDPCFPAQWHERRAAAESRPLKRWPPAQIHQLEELRGQLLEKIAVLPQHHPRTLPDRFGYHSEPVNIGAESDAQIDIAFDFDPELGAIAFVPAFVPEEAGAYAFPKRFKIDVLESGGRWADGRWVRDEKRQKWTEVANWLNEDYPDPGLYPVFFNWTGRPVYRVRITVPGRQSETNDAFHAFGEIYLFRQKNGRLGDNMAVWGETVHFTATGALSKPPLWDVRYVYDGVAGLGMPLSEETAPVEDLMVEWEDDAGPGKPVRIVLDLGKIRQIGRVQLWPSEAPHGMALAGFGFPGAVSVELSATPAFEESTRFKVEKTHARMVRSNLLNVITGACKARYIRITVSDLSVYQGKTILGLGEIRVAEFDDVWSLNCNLSAEGIPAGSQNQLPRLVDGYSRHRRILREAEWIKGLAQRRPLDRYLAVVERQLASVRDAWNRTQLRFSLWIGGLLCAGLLGALGLQRLQRRRVLKGLRTRITRDLHDEVGSSLGGISLIAERLEEDLQDAGIGEDLADLSLLAREAAASLRDVVWVVDQGTINLHDLLQKLVERAERVLYNVDVSAEIPPDLPDLVLPLTAKRHLIMYFKEVMHNCAQHSGASRVQIKVSLNEQLCIGFTDNGCGFDPAAQTDGWGLESMKKRAEELGGRALINSRPGAGTVVELQVPVAALFAKNDHLYKTSN
jgi:signal transduction histidine kinase